MRGPLTRAGYAVWNDAARGIQIRFVGQGPEAPREAVLTRIAGVPMGLAWARQVHSDRVLTAREGLSGEGDALVSRSTGLALAVASADCVPVLLGGVEEIAAIHAGWRGIAAGVVEKTVARLREAPETLTAWIGPAIGACCYEVGYEVVARVAAASSPEVVIPGPRGRPHLNLPGAVKRQLQVLGVTDVRLLLRCTACDARTLWSFRRDGEKTGSNLAFIWRASP